MTDAKKPDKELNHGTSSSSDETAPKSDQVEQSSRPTRKIRKSKDITWWDKFFKLLIMMTIGAEAIEVKVYPETELGKFPPRVDLLVVIRDVEAVRSYAPNMRWA